MSDDQTFNLYSGNGQTFKSRNLKLPKFEKLESLEDPAGYIADEGLRDAVNVALALGQPLLLTGEPGTGKTQLAASLAYELGLPGPLVFNTKTTSSARDLFYSYDSLSHFHDAQFKKEGLKIEQYITYEALGLAILLSRPLDDVKELLPERLQGLGLVRSVVLIDEIDKAPRDLPNDVLIEIESMSFTVKETGQVFSSDQQYRPILILTSNSEKNLPDAFLRRCVFYHIPFPEKERLNQIAERRLGKADGFAIKTFDHAIKHFETIRGMGLKKKPATAEFLGWMQILSKVEIDLSDVKRLNPGQAKILASSYTALAKTQEDLKKLQQTFTKPIIG